MQVLVYTRSSNEYLKYTGKKKSNSFVNIKKYIKLFFICACVDLKEMGVLKILHSKMTEKSPLPPPEYTKTSTCLYSIVRLVDTFILSIVLTKVNKIRTKFVRKKKQLTIQKLDNRCYTMI